MKKLIVVATMAVCLRGWAQGVAGTGDAAQLAQQIQAMVAEPAVSRAHWGVMVMAMDGTPIYAMNEGQLFQPASNAKLFTTAAALALLGPERTFETRVEAAQAIPASGVLLGDLKLIGGGDANLSGRIFPYAVMPLGKRPAAAAPLRYLEEMADQVVAKGLKVVDGDVVGDDTYFAWEPYGTDWAVDDLVWGYGAPASALSVNDNQMKMTISPGANSMQPAKVSFEPDLPYYEVENGVISQNPYKNPVGVDRAVGSKVVRVYGGVDTGTANVEELAILDPAEYAAMAFKKMLEARGVEVRGKARAKHYDPGDVSGFLEASRRPLPLAFWHYTFEKNRPAPECVAESAGTAGSAPVTLATHTSVPLRDDVMVTNKESQNLHAEMMLRNVGAQVGGTCEGSLRSGAQGVRAMAVYAGIDKDDFVFYDGSGLSGHDLVTPRAIAKLLQFASTQPWFADYKASLPIGGVDGSLESRFTKSPLKGHVFAKTGTLGETRALSGYLECASGRTVIFSVMVGNHAPGSRADRDVMDRIVAAIAAAN